MRPVARPLLDVIARTPPFDENQEAPLVEMSFVEPSDMVAMAANCAVSPSATVSGPVSCRPVTLDGRTVLLPEGVAGPLGASPQAAWTPTIRTTSTIADTKGGRRI